MTSTWCNRPDGRSIRLLAVTRSHRLLGGGEFTWFFGLAGTSEVAEGVGERADRKTCCFAAVGGVASIRQEVRGRSILDGTDAHAAT